MSIVGRPLPAFALPDLEGRTWTEADLKHGRAVVFCFASW
jgi:peroxiredoxin